MFIFFENKELCRGDVVREKFANLRLYCPFKIAFTYFQIIKNKINKKQSCEVKVHANIIIICKTRR